MGETSRGASLSGPVLPKPKPGMQQRTVAIPELPGSITQWWFLA